MDDYTFQVMKHWDQLTIGEEKLEQQRCGLGDSCFVKSIVSDETLESTILTRRVSAKNDSI